MASSLDRHCRSHNIAAECCVRSSESNNGSSLAVVPGIASSSLMNGVLSGDVRGVTVERECLGSKVEAAEGELETDLVEESVNGDGRVVDMTKQTSALMLMIGVCSEQAPRC